MSCRLEAEQAQQPLDWLVWEKVLANCMELIVFGVLLHKQMVEFYDKDDGFRNPGGIIMSLTEADLENLAAML